MDHTVIPVNRPTIPKNAKKYLDECVSSGWFSSEGPFVKRFEESFARYLVVSHATTTNTGTAALHLAILSLGIGEGDEVILPALTIASCFFAIWHTGAKAVPVDIDPEIYTINPTLIEKKITKRTRAIMVVHLFGHPCDMDPIMKLARKYKLAVIEDAAQAHGAEYKGKKVGSIGDVGIFSFYANKLVTTGEGGMLVSNHTVHMARAEKFKSLHHSKTRFIHDGIGYNYLMSNMQAALGLASLEEINASIKKKREMATYYQTHLSNIPGLILPIENPWAKSTYWMYAVRIDPKEIPLTRGKLMEKLRKRGIQTRTFFYSPRTAFKKLGIYQNTHFPVAEMLEKAGFYLPSGLGNTVREYTKTAQVLRQIIKKMNYYALSLRLTSRL